MVPKENSYRSDMALADLVQKFPQQVVLGCLYSGVQTPFVKSTGVSAFPPFFKDGYSLESGKFHYPESPTYPLVSYHDEQYVGRVGSFTVTPFRAVDEIPRWVPLWYHAGGKAHAYNLLGGKQSVLPFELPRDNREKVEGLRAGLVGIATNKVTLQEEVASAGDELAELSLKKTKVEDALAGLQEYEAELSRLDEEIDNFQQTLLANPVLKQIVEPQIKVRADERQKILRELLSSSSGEAGNALSGEQLAAESERLKTEISTFEKTLEENPALSAIIQPQIDQRITRREELLAQIESLQSVEAQVLSAEEIEQARAMLISKSAHLEEQLNARLGKLAQAAQSLQTSREALGQLEAEEAQLNLMLSRYEGKAGAELVESNNTLRLIYQGSRADGSDGTLVDSLPNLVPLNRSGKIFALGVEALLAYYGLEDEAVQIDEDYKTFSIVHPQAGTLVQSSMTEGQFLEVNWFSKWSETREEKLLTLQAKRAYVDMKNYPTACRKWVWMRRKLPFSNP